MTDLRERLEYYRSAYRGLETLQDTAEQSDVNRVFGGSTQAERLPKGLSQETLKLVEKALSGCDRDVSAADLAAQLGISRVSARRYLEYLSDTGRAEVTLRYGEVGRPERRYTKA
ncbi:hypothetical protein GCM10027403_06970 [Arthrobacter tecti]